MNNAIKGYVAGIISAITFGMNPFFGIHLYNEGITTLSVLFYRFFFGAVLLGIYVFAVRKPFVISRRLIPHVVIGGVLLALCCLSWFSSFKIMDSGIGATLMFVYPVMVAAVMIVGFHEKLTWNVVVATVLSLGGVAVLCRPGEGAVVNFWGVVFVMLSALFYTIYIVMLKVTKLKTVPAETLTFYTLGVGSLVFLAALRGGADLQMLRSWSAVGNSMGLAFFPSLLSFLLIAVSVKYIGATRSAILGALEPVTAVVIGYFVFNEKFTWALLAGIVLILSSVVIIVCGENQECETKKIQEV